MSFQYNRRICLVPCLFCCLVLAISNGNMLHADDFDPLAQKGKLQEVAEPVGKLLTFRWSAGALELNRTSESTELSLFERVRRAAGGSGSSGSSSGGNSRSRRFSRSDLSGEIVLSQSPGILGIFVKRRPSVWPSIRVKLSETKAPHRTLVVEQDDKGKLEISIKSNRYRFRMKQKSDGTVLVQEIRPDGVFAKSEPSFLLFCCKHREYVEKKLLPLLKHFGMKPPETSRNLQVQATAIARLRPLSDADRNEFSTLLKQLNDDSFAERRKATQKLTARYPVFQYLIRDAAQEKTHAKETRNRLAQVVKSGSGANGEKIIDFLDKSGLHRNPHYLVSILERITDQKDRELILDTLREKTKQSFGTDLAAWKKWLVANESKVAKTPIETTSLLSEKGAIQNLTKPIGQILKFKIQENRLRLDREHWSKPFGGKSIAQHEKEIEQEIAKRGFPPDWFSRRHYGANHVQVLFHNFCKSANIYQRSRSGSGWNSVTEAKGTNLEAKLMLGQSRPRNPGSSSFRLNLLESKGTGHSFDVLDDGRGVIAITIQSDASDFLLRLSQRADGKVFVDELYGNRNFSTKADSFGELLVKHSEFATKSLLPLMKHFGMVLPSEISKKVEQN